MNEKQLITSALRSSDPSKEIKIACKNILNARLEEENVTDNKLRYIIEDIIQNLDFSIETKLNRSSVQLQAQTKPDNNSSIIVVFAVSLIIGIILSIGDQTLLRITGAIVSAISGFLISKSLNKTIQEPQVTYNINVVSTVEEIENKMDNIYNQFKPLFRYNQLDCYHKDILLWLQKRHSESSDESLKNNIKNLLLNGGYELVEYNPKYNDFFKFNKSNNVDSYQTTVCAVRNSETKSFVLEGHVIFPFEED